MLELKRNVNDPVKIDTDVSRALDLAFDNKELVNLPAMKETSETGTKNKSNTEKLKLNTE